MKQSHYEAIIHCIQYGAPALSQDLISSFVQVVQNSNEYITAQQKAQEQARKAKEVEAKEQAKKEANDKANLDIKKSTK